MSDPSDYHTIPHEALNGQTLAQLKDLKRCLEDRIASKMEIDSKEYALSEEVANELAAEGPTSVSVSLLAVIKPMPYYNTFTLKSQKAVEHPEVQAFFEKIRMSIHSKLSKERLEAVGLTEDSRETVENLVLRRLR